MDEDTPKRHPNIEWLLQGGRDEELLFRVDDFIGRMRQDAVAQNEAAPTELPEVAPERWSQRLNKAEKVPEFLERVWWRRGYRGLLTQTALRQLDSGLRIAIFDHCRVAGIEPTSLVPAKYRRGASEEAVALLKTGKTDEALRLASPRAIRNRLRKERDPSGGAGRRTNG